MLANDYWNVGDDGSLYACSASDGPPSSQGLINTIMNDPKTVVRTLLGSALYGTLPQVDSSAQWSVPVDSSTPVGAVGSEPDYVASYGKGWDVPQGVSDARDSVGSAGNAPNDVVGLMGRAQSILTDQAATAQAHQQIPDLATALYSQRQLYGDGSYDGVVQSILHNNTTSDGFYDPVANAKAMSLIDGVMDQNDYIRGSFAGQIGTRVDQLINAGKVVLPYAESLFPGNDGYDMARRMAVYSDAVSQMMDPSSSGDSTGSESMQNQQLGYVSRHFESGNRGVSTVSSGVGDPKGGISYGAYQLSSKTGTMTQFLNSPEASDYRHVFQGLIPGTDDFNEAYRMIAAQDAQGLDAAQTAFITRTHYDPVVAYANESGLDTSDCMVQEALYSQAVQHGLGGNQRIISDAVASLPQGASPDQQVAALYAARANYVNGLSTIPVATKQSLLRRYVNEQAIVQGMGDY